MIRFVEMTGIYLDGTKSFGFFNTVTGQFLKLNGTHAFDDVQEFEDMYTDDCGYEFDRLKNKIPKRWLDKSRD